MLFLYKHRKLKFSIERKDVEYKASFYKEQEEIIVLGMRLIDNRLTQLHSGPTMNLYYSAQLYYPQIDIQRAVNRMMAEGVDSLDEMYPQLEDTVNKNLKIINNAYSFLSKNLLTEENKDILEEINEILEKK